MCVLKASCTESVNRTSHWFFLRYLFICFSSSHWTLIGSAKFIHFISLVLVPLNSLVWYVPSLRYTRGLGWRIHCGVEVTESSTNKQHIIIFTLIEGTERVSVSVSVHSPLYSKMCTFAGEEIWVFKCITFKLGFETLLARFVSVDPTESEYLFIFIPLWLYTWNCILWWERELFMHLVVGARVVYASCGGSESCLFVLDCVTSTPQWKGFQYKVSGLGFSL
jgi:hypothetical protein